MYTVNKHNNDNNVQVRLIPYRLSYTVQNYPERISKFCELFFFYNVHNMYIICVCFSNKGTCISKQLLWLCI